MGEGDGSPDGSFSPSRRTLIAGSAAIAAAAAIGISRLDRMDTAASTQAARDQILRTVTGDLYVPSTGGFDSVGGISPFITPVDSANGNEFYVLDIALQRPNIDPADWSLNVGGPHVDNPLSLSYDELLNRDLVTAEVTLPCISNPIGGELIGNAFWTGVPLTELLEEAGVRDPSNTAHQLFSRAADDYSAGYPLPRAFDGRTAMVALFMNGEVLPRDHGFPARLITSGMYADVCSTKWLTSIEVTDWVGVDGYWQPRGWSKDAAVRTQSRIDTPVRRDGAVSGPTTIAGVAWNPAVGIAAVEVGFANAADPDAIEWVSAELAEVESVETWVQWRYEWNAPPGDWIMAVRATDNTGFTQPSEQEPAAPYGVQGHHTVAIRAT